MQNRRKNHTWALRIAGLTSIFLIFLMSNLYAYTVTGKVTGSTGPLEGIDIFLDCCATEGRVSTDEDGNYSFTTEGAQISASIIVVPPLESKLAQSTRLLDINDDMSGVDFHLVQGNLLAGRVVNQNGYPVNLDHDLVNSQGAKHILDFNDFAEFLAYLPPDNYTLRMYISSNGQTDHSIDLPKGEVLYWEVTHDISDEALPLPPDRDPVQQLPPLIDKISIGEPDDAGKVHIFGTPGTVMPGVPFLEIINLHTGNFTVEPVLADGSFEADILAPYGSALLMRLGRFNRYNRYGGTSTILWVFPPAMGLESGKIPVYLAGNAGNYEGHWWATGTINNSRFNPEDTFTANLNITITSPLIDDSFDNGEHRLVSYINFERFFDQSGKHGTRVQRGVATSLTPTGFPINSESSKRRYDYTPLTLVQETTIQPAYRSGNILNFQLTLSGILHSALTNGYYRPALYLLLGTDEAQFPLSQNPYLGVDEGFENRAELGLEENTFATYLPMIQIGDTDTPRLPWALLLNTFSNGERGTIAREERELVGISTRNAFQGGRLVVPPQSSFDQVISYRLEPFIPTLSSSLASDVEPYPPIIPIKYPGGQFHTTVSMPDGSVDDLGVSAFRQSRNGIEEQRYRYYIGADRTLQKIYEATTLSDQYIYKFDQYGLHVIQMKGHVEDVWGNTYQGGGTYELWVAEPLELEPAVFPGQPFEVGDVLAASVTVYPPVPAFVNLEFQLVPANGVPITYSVSGQANLFGYFQPTETPFILQEPGEYEMNIVAEYRDKNGVLWVGSSRSGGVVETPDSDLKAHGLRGMTSFNEVRPQWFFSSNLHPEGLKENILGIPEDQTFMLLYPYFTGDILWVSDKNNSIIAELSVHDTVGWYGDLLLQREEQVPHNARIDRDLEERNVLGELPFVTTTSDGSDWGLFPEKVDCWSYAYLSTQRPGISVRGYVGTDNLGRTYWSTDYNYDRQFGVGEEGDIANDIKLHYGGGVIRTAGYKEYLGYASMEIITPHGEDELGVRTFPPFQGYSGGPDGGPILTLNGEEIDLFLTPTGLRPGSILEVGDSASIAGTMWPTLDSKGWFTVTAPSGSQKTVYGQANKFGYFYAADGDFTVNEAGVWTVEARLVHDEIVPSTGLAPIEHNTGDLLGARLCNDNSDPVGCGQFYFYVTKKETPRLSLETSSLPRFASMIPITIEGEVPTGWTDVSGKFTTVMSGFILEEGNLIIRNGRYQYVFDPFNLRENFPNLDLEMADTISISMLLSGEKDGTAIHRAGVATILGKKVFYTPPDETTDDDILQLEAFVTRFYQLCLGRNPDPAGLSGWITSLSDGSKTGADVAWGFIFSPEFISQNTSNEDYLTILYKAFFNRNPDTAGWDGWLAELNNGTGREIVLNGFIYAQEFNNLCWEYGISPNSVAAFVTRFYKLCLFRDPERDGLEGWTNELLSQVKTGAGVAEGFIYSQEFVNRNTTNEEYLTVLYKAFFNRDPDPLGWETWLSELNKGKDRGEVLDGFIYSTEFSNLCNEYGIKAY